MECEDSYDVNINMVKEMILDEEKIVTYITIGKDLCIHVNESKKLLQNTIKNIREEQPEVNLNVNFIISGLYVNNTATTKICIEQDLDKIKNSLRFIFFCHIYSVCKGSQRIDKASLLLLNNCKTLNLCTGAIRSKEGCTRKTDKVANFTPLNEELSNGKINESKKKAETMNMEKTKDEDKSELRVKTEVISPKKEFSNIKQLKYKRQIDKSQKCIESFFCNPINSQGGNKCNESIHTNNVEKVNIKHDIGDIIENTTKETISKNLKSESVIEQNVIKSELKPSATYKMFSKDLKTLNVDRKRKVLHISDSENDEDCKTKAKQGLLGSNKDFDDEIPSTPSVESCINITSGIINTLRKRKIVGEANADQCRVNRKDADYKNSCDSNPQLKIKKNKKEIKNVFGNSRIKCSPKKLKKKLLPATKGKQQTLNNFFQTKLIG